MASPQDTPPNNLTGKQAAFVRAYTTNGFNATQAAITAGYAESSAHVTGHENIRNPKIKAEIDRILAQHAMSPEEVIARLTDHARGDLGDLWDDSTGQVNWAEARRQGKTALIKRIKHKTTRITREDGTDVETFEDEIELHNPQVALQLLGKQHGLFVDKSETKITAEVNVKTYKGISPDDWDDTDTGK